jgi:hypothetical protein
MTTDIDLHFLTDYKQNILQIADITDSGLFLNFYSPHIACKGHRLKIDHLRS